MGLGRILHSLTDQLFCCWFSWFHQGAVSSLLTSFLAPGPRPGLALEAFWLAYDLQVSGMRSATPLGFLG